MKKQVLHRIGETLRERGWMLSLAESCTGGVIGDTITNLPGSSDYFAGGIIAYSNQVKIDLLGVSADLLKRDGAVSASAALFMARGVRRVFKTDLSVSVTGIAGPGGGSPLKPVGLVYMAAVSPAEEKVEEHHFAGTRPQIKNLAAAAALNLLRSIL